MTIRETEAAWRLLTASAVRERAAILLERGLAGKLRCFTVHPEQIDAVADYVLATTRAAYPDLDVPFHARWRHFNAGGRDRWQAFAGTQDWSDTAERARTAFDLAIVSVLLDAGSGPGWQYREPDGTVTTRSEGLAVASLAMMLDGAFSAGQGPFATAEGLMALTPAHLAAGFQAGPGNPLAGLEGRVALLNRLGTACRSAAGVFATQGGIRPGGLFDHLAEQTVDASLPATAILEALLRHLGPIWPSRLSLGGVPLGDCWQHPDLLRDDPTSGFVPFHKLSQWLAYSLIEPLRWGGISVTDIDGLTGLPEYRNGGLLLDLGLIRLKDAEQARAQHLPGSVLVVEWRALTVALLDRIAARLRERLGLDAESLPLAKVLEGGTWAAGRRIARDKRPDGGPPLQIVSDGTVF